MEVNKEGREGNVRKRRSSSSSSSSSLMAPDCRLKRTFLMGKRRGSTTPVPNWKMISSHHREAVSARKMAAVLWEIDLLHSHRFKIGTFHDKKCGKRRSLESSKLRSLDLAFSHSVGKSDPNSTELCSCKRRALGGCPKLMRHNSNIRSTFIPSFLGQPTHKNQVDEAQRNEQKKNLKDIHNGLRASKQLLQVLSRVEQLDCTSTALVSALKAELDRSCDRVSKLMGGQKTNKSEIDALLKQIKHNDIPSVVRELEEEKKLRRTSEKLKKKSLAELAEAKASLAMAMKEVESEKKARRKVEQVCEELARGIWELKRQFAKVGEEVEKEREMFHLADLLREERVQMKLSEAKCLYEEQNAVNEKLRSELAAYLGGAKSNEVERVLGEKGSGKNAAAENEEESDDSDLEAIELSMDGFSSSFLLPKVKKESSFQKQLENQEFFARPTLSQFT